LIAPDTHAGVGIAEVVADDVAGSGAGDDAGLGVVVALAARDGVVGRVYPVREYLHPVAWVTVGFTLADQVVVALDIPTVVKGCSAVVVSGAVQELATVRRCHARRVLEDEALSPAVPGRATSEADMSGIAASGPSDVDDRLRDAGSLEDDVRELDPRKRLPAQFEHVITSSRLDDHEFARIGRDSNRIRPTRPASGELGVHILRVGSATDIERIPCYQRTQSARESGPRRSLCADCRVI